MNDPLRTGDGVEVDAARVPDWSAIDRDGGIDDVPADFTWSIGAAGMEMQQSWIAECAAAPLLR